MLSASKPVWLAAADAVGAVEQVHAAEAGAAGDAGDLRRSAAISCLRRGAGGRVVGTGVGCLNGQVTHAGQHGVHFVERTFSRLHDRDAVLSVAGGLTQATDLGTQALADDKAGSVVGCTVDAEA